MFKKYLSIIQIAVFLVVAIGLIQLAGRMEEESKPISSDRSPELSNKPDKKKKKKAGKKRAATNKRMEAGLRINRPEKVWKGLTLIPTEGDARVRLINMNGEEVSSWNIDAVRARLQADGSLLSIHGTNWGKELDAWKNLNSTMLQHDNQGKEIWRFENNLMLHHDFQRLPGGNILMLRRLNVPDSFYSKIKDDRLKNKRIRSDEIIEITPAGEIVWNWYAHEHLDLNSCGSRDCLGNQSEQRATPAFRDWTHTNTLTVIPENKWYRKGHKAFKPGNLIILPRNWWTVLIIDRETGAVVWRYSGDYKGGISGGHEASMIPEGLPGAGNILVFDNGRKVHSGESYVLEIDPLTLQPVWVYDAGKSLYSSSKGSVQRLPNGNTIISEDKRGRCFEVTREKEIVWEYQSAFETNRCRRYSLDFKEPALSTSEN